MPAVRVIVVGVEPELDQLTTALNQHLADADPAVLIHITADPASETALTLWNGDGWQVETPLLGTIPVMVCMVLMAEHRPDRVFVAKPQDMRHPLAAGIRESAKRAGIPVVELKPRRHWATPRR